MNKGALIYARLIELWRKQEYFAVGEEAERLGCGPELVAYHLNKLEDADLIERCEWFSETNYRSIYIEALEDFVLCGHASHSGLRAGLSYADLQQTAKRGGKSGKASQAPSRSALPGTKQLEE